MTECLQYSSLSACCHSVLGNYPKSNFRCVTPLIPYLIGADHALHESIVDSVRGEEEDTVGDEGEDHCRLLIIDY